MNLYQKLIAIMSEAGTMAKKGRNEHQRYDYVREADVSEKFQELLVKHGVFVFSSVDDVTERETTNAKGRTNTFATVHVTYTFVNADNPEEQFKVGAAGSGVDVGDKGIYKALTGAHKYFLIRNFNLGSDDDAEVARPDEKPERRTGHAPVDTSDIF
jgi:hypothetical protein